MLELDKSQVQIQKAVRDFAKGEFDKDAILDLEKAREYPKAIWRKAADLGFIGIHDVEVFAADQLMMHGDEKLAAAKTAIDAAV